MQPFGKICTPSWVKFVQKKSNLGKNSPKDCSICRKNLILKYQKYFCCAKTLIDIVCKGFTAGICIADSNTRTLCKKCL